MLHGRCALAAYMMLETDAFQARTNWSSPIACFLSLQAQCRSHSTFGVCLGESRQSTSTSQNTFGNYYNHSLEAFSCSLLKMADSTADQNVTPTTQPESSNSTASPQTRNAQPESTSSSSSAPPQACAQCGKSSDSLKQCIKCHSVTYCNKDCQKAHFKAHKKACPILAQEYVKLHEPKMASKSSASAAGGRERGLQKWQVRCSMLHFHVKVGANVNSLILESA
jgi:hypothetical protein